MGTVNQRNVTRNQSTADYSVKKIFVFDNRFVPSIVVNPDGEDVEAVTVTSGMLVTRVTGQVDQVQVATAANLANVIGVTKLEGSVDVEPDAQLNIDVCTKGTIDGNQLTLPSGVTLNTTVGTKVLKDVLESLGLHIDTSSVEHTAFDN